MGDYTTTRMANASDVGYVRHRRSQSHSPVVYGNHGLRQGWEWGAEWGRGAEQHQHRQRILFEGQHGQQVYSEQHPSPSHAWTTSRQQQHFEDCRPLYATTKMGLTVGVLTPVAVEHARQQEAPRILPRFVQCSVAEVAQQDPDEEGKCCRIIV